MRSAAVSPPCPLFGDALGDTAELLSVIIVFYLFFFFFGSWTQECFLKI
jgi:hypothetical protein